MLASMTKSEAIELLGGTTVAAARAIGITPSAIHQWPDDLPARLEDRVLAALARKHLPPSLLRPRPNGDEGRAADHEVA